MDIVKRIYDAIMEASRIGPTNIIIVHQSKIGLFHPEITVKGGVLINTYLGHRVIISTNIDVNEIIVA